MINGLDFIEKNINSELLENGLLEIYKINNNIKINDNEINKNNIINYREEFLKTNILKEINNTLDNYLKEIFPDSLGEDLINIKNNIINNNIKNTIYEKIEKATEKNVKNINDYETISNIQENMMKKENINEISKNIEKNIDKSVDKNTDIIIKEELKKEDIINNVEDSIDKTFEKQKNNIKKIEKHIKNWENKYNLKDIEGMKKEYDKMEKLIDNLMPLENVINNYRKIENIQNLLENNNDFYLDDQVLELANKFN